MGDKIVTQDEISTASQNGLLTSKIVVFHTTCHRQQLLCCDQLAESVSRCQQLQTLGTSVWSCTLSGTGFSSERRNQTPNIQPTDHILIVADDSRQYQLKDLQFWRLVNMFCDVEVLSCVIIKVRIVLPKSKNIREGWYFLGALQACKFNENQIIDSRYDSRNIQL